MKHNTKPNDKMSIAALLQAAEYLDRRERGELGALLDLCIRFRDGLPFGCQLMIIECGCLPVARFCYSVPSQLRQLIPTVLFFWPRVLPVP